MPIDTSVPIRENEKIYSVRIYIDEVVDGISEGCMLPYEASGTPTEIQQVAYDAWKEMAIEYGDIKSQWTGEWTMTIYPINKDGSESRNPMHTLRVGSEVKSVEDVLGEVKKGLYGDNDLADKFKVKTRFAMSR